jgi:hypothetical protein
VNVNGRFVRAIALIAILWQGPAWAYLNIAATANPLPAGSTPCLTIGGDACGDCCGNGAGSSCQAACALLGTTAVSMNTSVFVLAAVYDDPLNTLPVMPFVSRNDAPPIRPPIP